MTTAPTQAQYDNLHLLMDVVDTVRHARMDAQRMAGEAMDEAALVAQVRETYRSQGMVVDEATIQEGLAMLKARRFEFTPPRAGLATRLAELYVSRACWGPKVLRRTGAAVAMVAVLALAIQTVSTLRARSWLDDARQSVALAQGLEQQAQALDAQLARQAQAPRALGLIRAQGQEQVDRARKALLQAPALPAASLESFYAADTDKARGVVERREGALKQARSHLAQARALQDKGVALQALAGQASAFDQPVPGHLEGLRRVQRQAFEAGLAAGEPAAMEAAVNTLNQALALDTRREALAVQAGQIQGPAAKGIGEGLAQAGKALAAGNLVVATIGLDQAQSTLAVLPMGYTLRVVSEPGEKTGVWRYYGQDRSKRSFYIVVDAVDAAGQPVKLPVRSVEDGTTATTSRFAVRVPEKVYDAVGKDKMDDGIIDQPIFGTKQPGELEPQYRFDTLDGAITTW